MKTLSHNTLPPPYPWSSSTNWTICQGSLDASITFDSSHSPDTDSAPIDPTRKPHLLILQPPSPGSGPCEITLCFTQKHEVRQIYVRSTARVYETYCTPSLHSSNEYLCTVRCGAAARDEELLHATAIEEAAHSHLKGSSEEPTEVKSTGEGNVVTNEDDWVEVKVSDSPLLHNSINSLPNTVDGNAERSIQVFYEATAEITDADPCTSLTLRFLSLQKQGCVFVDEVYVFADPVESVDTENEAVQVANSAGSSFMAMIVPTLFQLSKSGVGQKLDKLALDKTEMHEKPQIGSISTYATDDAANEIHQDKKLSPAEHQGVKLHEVRKATAESHQFQIPSQFSEKNTDDDSATRNDFSGRQVEGVLEQLVSRMSRIEDICLRFEENMLKPMNMEARLQRVEQQLEALSKSPHYSELRTCTRFSAPAFSCNESNSNCYYNDGNDFSPCGASEFEKKDLSSDKLSNLPDELPISVSAPQFLPSLVVTAPEFSCGDDEDNNDVLEPSKDSPQKQTKQALSIDDALAAALAGFLSMSSTQCSKYTGTPSGENGNEEPSRYSQTLKVKAPDFIGDEVSSDLPSQYTQAVPIAAPEFAREQGKIVSPIIQNENLQVPVGSCETNQDEHIHDSVSTSSVAVSVVCVGSFEEVHFDHDSFEGGNSCSSLGTCTDCPRPRVTIELAGTDDSEITEGTIGIEAGYGVSSDTVSETNDVLNEFLLYQILDSCDVPQEKVSANVESVSGDVSYGDMLQNILESAYTCSVVDFEIPILDVEFSSYEITKSKSSPLDFLMEGVAESSVGPPCVEESSDSLLVAEQGNLIFVEDGEHMDPPGASDILLVDLDSCDVGYLFSNLEDRLQDPLTCSNHEVMASLI